MPAQKPGGRRHQCACTAPCYEHGRGQLTGVVALDQRQQHQKGNGGDVLEQQDTKGGLPKPGIQLGSLAQELWQRGRAVGGGAK